MSAASSGAAPRLRVPAWTPPPVRIAPPWSEEPSEALASRFREVHRDRMAGLPFLNERLAVEVRGMRRLDGDWLGALVTPWSVQLVLLPGGGRLWEDIPIGCRRAVALPVGALEFIADGGESEDALAAWQYCPLSNGVERFSGMEAARRFVADALAAVVRGPQSVAQPLAESAPRGATGICAAAVTGSGMRPDASGRAGEDVDLRRRGLLGLGRPRPAP